MHTPTKLLAVAAAGVVLAAGAIGASRYVSAQEPGDAPQAQDRQTAREDFIDKVAARLNITPDQLKGAVKAAGLETVDDLVAQGKLTEDQAAKIKEKINSGQGMGRLLGRIRHHRIQNIRVEFRQQVVTSSAAAIGIDADDLRDELKVGKSIADVAGEHSVSVDAVKAQITSDVQARLDEAVANGRITQARADAAMQRLTDNLDKIVNAKKAS